MSCSLAAQCSRIELALTRLERTLLIKALQPGASNRDVQEQLGLIGLSTTEEFSELYGWHDGTSLAGVSSLDDIQMFPGFYMLSVDEGASNYRTFADDPRWKDGWFPIFGNGGGDFYVAELSPGGASRIRHFRIDESHHPIEFMSIVDMFRTLAEAFDRHVFYVDSEGYLEMDDLEFAALAAQLNPDVDWWIE